jgi:hypothetical protein
MPRSPGTSIGVLNWVSIRWARQAVTDWRLNPDTRLRPVPRLRTGRHRGCDRFFSPFVRLTRDMIVGGGLVQALVTFVRSAPETASETTPDLDVGGT